MPHVRWNTSLMSYKSPLSVQEVVHKEAAHGDHAYCSVYHLQVTLYGRAHDDQPNAPD